MIRRIFVFILTCAFVAGLGLYPSVCTAANANGSSLIYDYKNLDKDAKFAVDLFDGKITPQNDLPGLSLPDPVVQNQLENSDRIKKRVVDIRQEGENQFVATVVQTEAIPLSRDNKLCSLKFLALEGENQDEFCNVTYFTRATYAKKYCSNDGVQYGYKITGVKGGIISIGEGQIIVTKLALGYWEYGEYYVNGQGGAHGIGTTKNLQAYTKTYPATGQTYSASGPSDNRYYLTEDALSGIQSRTTINIKRNNSSYTGSDYVYWLKGNEPSTPT